MRSKSEISVILAEPNEIEINRNELAGRLKTERGFQSEALEMCRKRLMENIRYKCAYVRTPVNLSEEGVCDLGFMKIPSKNLYKNLTGCGEAFVMAMTSGIAVDRLLARLNIVSQAEHFMTDALSSAAIESFCDYACKVMSSGYDCAPRFSPGFGDLSITFQKPLLEGLCAFEILGITLNNAFLMTPVKSITAIMGIRGKKNDSNEKDN